MNSKLIHVSNIDLLLSAAPVESHVGAVVVSKVCHLVSVLYSHTSTSLQDSPNACVTLAIPTGIFEHVRINELILLFFFIY